MSDESGGSPTVAHRSLRSQVADALRGALVSGELEPGTVYSAPTLAARFGVSATPVREAMLDLAKEGLVDAVRNKGFRVTVVSDRALDELTEIRELLEVPTVTRLAGRLSATDIDALRSLVARIEQTAEAGDLIRYVEADREFHLRLLGLSGNEQLVTIVGELRARARLFGLHRLARQGDLATSAREHAALLDALEAGDAEVLEKLMRQHLGHVRGIWAHS
ncbi:MAG TPA: GntR family transcriptional regulator [Jatrophihabitantaceae bacterium]